MHCRRAQFGGLCVGSEDLDPGAGNDRLAIVDDQDGDGPETIDLDSERWRIGVQDLESDSATGR
jgi:hypothetical protein